MRYIRFVVDGLIFSMIPHFCITAVEGHAVASKADFNTLLVNTHNLCDRIFVSVKGLFPYKWALRSL